MSEDLWAGTPGQQGAVAALQAAVVNPVHGSRSAARSFAAALLCPDGGCGTCSHCMRAMALHHPDLIMARHEGPFWRVEEIREIVGQAQRRPLEAARTVIVLPDAHLLSAAAPALLKTLEEPPATTIFILLADDLPRSLETIRSRCSEVRFETLSPAAIAQLLISDGIDPVRAADPGFAGRLERWKDLSRRLDGSGQTVVTLVGEIQDSLAEAEAPLVARQKAELADFDAEASDLGLRASGRKEMLDHHKREVRSYRDGEVRAGLGVLARSYRETLRSALATGDDAAADMAMGQIDAISRHVSVMRRNPRPTLSLERLLLALG